MVYSLPQFLKLSLILKLEGAGSRNVNKLLSK